MNTSAWRAARAGRRRRAGFQIERQAALAAIDAEKIRAPVADERRPPPRIVALRGLFDFDDVGAHVAEQHRAEGTGEHTGEIDDFESVERGHGENS